MKLITNIWKANIQFRKRTNWILPFILKRTPIPEAPTFYTDANKMGMADYKSDKISKVIKSPYTSGQKSKSYYDTPYGIIRLS